MLEIASQITVCLLLAALIGFVIGYIVGKGSRKQDATQEPKIETTETTEIEEEIEEDTNSKSSNEVEIPTSDAIEKVAEALEAVEAQETIEEDDSKETAQEEGIKPELFSSEEGVSKDELTQIKGIGPKMEDKLNEAGIYNFEQIANWSEDNLKWLEQNTTFAHRAKKDLWVNQAKELV